MAGVSIGPDVTAHSTLAHARPPTRAERANPILQLPAMHRLRELDPEVQACLRALLLDLQRDARLRAKASWDSRKPPMAAYWAAVGVYAGHIARVLLRSAKSELREGAQVVGKPLASCPPNLTDPAGCHRGEVGCDAHQDVPLA